ncbi:uncharacterized protein KY384_000175 [Bacidia gigantensis]|uniref:uncharacterized protein n=1 Tax=Bacidia gigantensis TaxID=2732470 RepID=UPI001D03F4BD|nr:uncharacterized protein KY384_000175 [Bacidia gigantensis]KAG8526182.1 hypothetical protein KY384_000175 [Bacidia gigantensis]
MTLRKTSNGRNTITEGWPTKPTAPRAPSQGLSKPLPQTPSIGAGQEIQGVNEGNTRSFSSHSEDFNMLDTRSGERPNVVQGQASSPAGPQLQEEHDKYRGDMTPRSSSETARVWQEKVDPSYHVNPDVVTPEEPYPSISSNPFRRAKDDKPPVLDLPNLGVESSADIWDLDPKPGSTSTESQGVLREPWTSVPNASSRFPDGIEPHWPRERLLNETIDVPFSTYAERPQGKAPNASRPKSNEIASEFFDTGNKIASDGLAGTPPITHHLIASPELPTIPVSTSEAGDYSFEDSQFLLDLISNSDHSDTAHPHAAEMAQVYEIRKTMWTDPSSPSKPILLPVMMQNTNGPCPLLALVNALVLSCPGSTGYTTLADRLRDREQVTLGNLIDYVIEELLHGDPYRRQIPLHRFYELLVRLNNGMNVNPILLPQQEQTSILDAPISELSIEGRIYEMIAGFKPSLDLKLYGTFGVPLVHSWLVSPDDVAFESIKRSASDHEQSQNILVEKLGLETRLNTVGLDTQERELLGDAIFVKSFLDSTATQTSPYGLKYLAQKLRPGSVSIYFRNNHFNTLYKHRDTSQLFTLVTDEGLASRSEVVWESVVDMNGQGGSTFFTWEFNPVGDIGDIRETVTVDRHGWQSVTREIQMPTANIENLNIDGSQAASVNREQEDHDLAYALQLQEEEDDRQRREQEARRRENDASERYVSNSDASGRRTFPGFARGGRGGAPLVPPRGGSMANTVHGTARQAPPPATNSARQAPPVSRRRNSSEEAPPPSYEQAARSPVYNAPDYSPTSARTRAASTNQSRPQGVRHRTTSSAYAEHAAAFPGGPSTHGPPMPRRPTGEGRAYGERYGPRPGGRGGRGEERLGDEEERRRDGKCTMM